MQIDDGQTSQVHSIAAGKSFWVSIQSRAFGTCLALLSLFSIALYVFAFTEYETYVYSDMQGDWLRALERLNGIPFLIKQYWTAWPPEYHIFLAEVFAGNGVWGTQ